MDLNRPVGALARPAASCLGPAGLPSGARSGD